MRERIKDYRVFQGQNYFRGNTAARCRRIRDLDKRIFSKRFHRSMITFVSLVEGA